MFILSPQFARRLYDFVTSLYLAFGYVGTILGGLGLALTLVDEQWIPWREQALLFSLAAQFWVMAGVGLKQHWGWVKWGGPLLSSVAVLIGLRATLVFPFAVFLAVMLGMMFAARSRRLVTSQLKRLMTNTGLLSKRA